MTVLVMTFKMTSTDIFAHLIFTNLLMILTIFPFILMIITITTLNQNDYHDEEFESMIVDIESGMIKSGFNKRNDSDTKEGGNKGGFRICFSHERFSH